MSAYIVNELTINRVINLIILFSKEREFTERRYPLLKNAILRPSKMGNKLYSMNVKAINSRYDNNINIKEIDNYSYSNIDISKHQGLKSIECFLYQCSEGNITNYDLYKELTELRSDLISNIVFTSDEYKKAEWK